MNKFLKFATLTVLVSALTACGSKDDFSSNNELSKTQNNAAAGAAPNGASVHKALMVPQQKRP